MVSRRQIIAASAASAAVWSAPSVVALDRVAAATPSGCAPEVPTVDSGAMLIAPPPELAPNSSSLDNNTTTFVFIESSCVVLDAPITVDRSTAGVFNGNSNQGATIPAGTKICSYIVHGDRLDNNGRLTGAAMFSINPILGLIYEMATFNATSFLEVPGTNYVYGPMEGSDNMTLDLTPGANRVTWDMRFGGVTDQIRIITAC